MDDSDSDSSSPPPRDENNNSNELLPLPELEQHQPDAFLTHIEKVYSEVALSLSQYEVSECMIIQSQNQTKNPNHPSTMFSMNKV